MKVICIDKIGNPWITKELNIGETYEVISSLFSGSEVVYDIKTKYGSICWVLGTNFTTIQEYRNIKLKQLEI